MVKVVFVGHTTLIGMLEGNVLKSPLAIISNEKGFGMVPLIGVDKSKLSDVTLNQTILSYEVTESDVIKTYIKATTGLILAS